MKLKLRASSAAAVAGAGHRLSLSAGQGVRSPSQTVRGLPGPKPRWPWGNLGQVDANGLHATLEAWAERYGPIFKFRFGATTLVGITDSTLIAEVLRHRPEVFSRGERLSRIIDETAPTGVFTAEGEQWRRQRKLVMRALTPEAIKGFFPLIQTVTGRLEDRWRNAARQGRTCDVVHDLKCYAVDIATGLAIGEDVNTLEQPEHSLQADIEFWFALIGRRLVSPIAYWRWFSRAPERRLREVQRRRDALLRRVVEGARARLAADPDRRLHPANILEALVAARDAPGSEFSDEDVAGNIMTMLFAGEDTVANATAWLMFDIATRPAVADDARAEVDRLVSGPCRAMHFGLLDDFKRLEAIASESMRIKPVAPMLGVTALKEVSLAQLRIHPGQTIYLMTRVASKLSGTFPSPDVFDADRWTVSSASGLQDPHRKVFPFGAGARLCPGRYLAMVEMKMVAAMAMKAFDFSLDAGPQTCRERFTFTMGPQSLPIRFVERVGGS